MMLPPRLGVVLCGLLLLVTSSAAFRPPSVTDHRSPPSADHRPSSATDHKPSVTDHRPPPAAKLTSGEKSTSRQESLVRDCSDLPDGTPSGVYPIKPDQLTSQFVYCDMSDGDKWTVFQRRANFTPRQDFQLNWEAYKWGFGDLEQEFWWGLHFLWQLTSEPDRIYELRVDLWDWEEETRYATYQDFTIASEADGYRLSYTDYLGNAGDSLDVHKGMQFTTADQDNDMSTRNCASHCAGAWWYNDCFESNLNGLYSHESEHSENFRTVIWNDWRYHYALKTTTMKIRPTKKL